LGLIDCESINQQGSMQELVHCLRGFDLFDDGTLYCLIPDPDIPPNDPYYPLRSDIVLTPVPADFAPLDRDADQIHSGIVMEILAFVDGDYPVLFEADRAGFQDDQGHHTSTSYYCYTLIQDPDCDGAPDDPNPDNHGDHVVAARFYLNDDIRGDMHVTVTQNGHSVVKTIHVVGPPVTISVQAINGKDTIESGATAPTHHGDTPLSTACDFPGEQQALAGIASPKKTALLVKALDSDGNEVAGSLIDWSPPFVTFSGGPALDPAGGAFFSGLPMLDLGAAGIGYPQIICGGVDGDELVSIARFNGVFDVPGDWNYMRTFTVHVLDTPGDTDGDGIANASDNCPAIANVDQSNNDRNFVDLPAPKLFDDTSRPHSDNLGDACDPDNDNDGLTDAEELGLGPFGPWSWLCSATSANTNPLLADSDGDGTLDGAECELHTDPASAASKPPTIVETDTDSDGLPDGLEVELHANLNNPDTDGDHVLDGVEYRGYGTDPTLTDTDGDGCADGKEIASVDGLSAVNSIDLQQVAKAYSASWDAPNYILDFDMNKNGQINSIDLQFVARMFGPC
jgi:hypothetical protein